MSGDVGRWVTGQGQAPVQSGRQRSVGGVFPRLRRLRVLPWSGHAELVPLRVVHDLPVAGRSWSTSILRPWCSVTASSVSCPCAS